MKPVVEQITPYSDVNEVLAFVTDQISASLGSSLVGLYLFGSLTYDDFDPKRSDIDLVAVLEKPATSSEIDDLQEILSQLKEKHPKWANRVEVSYTPKEMFEKTEPPGKRPYFGDGRFWPDAQYGNEWIINNYLLYKHGLVLFGPDVKSLLTAPSIDQVKTACIKDFHEEWEPILRNKDWLDDSHYQSYVVLNLCRILYTVANSDVRSKKVATSWVISKFPDWAELIQAADNWKYGNEFSYQEGVLEFIRFVEKQIGRASQL
ncbi:MAG: DUF4111 domain-containing protein [Chloroflexi bacterium]|nr:DUF4111 domain-containing protein [Chloroflexota bacterium]